jgi:hypothetical protein
MSNGLPGYPIMLFSVDAREAGLAQDGRFLHIELHDLESSLIEKQLFSLLVLYSAFGIVHFSGT